MSASKVTFNIIYEEPSLIIRGLEAIRRGLERANCIMTVGPSWIVASCRGTFVKVLALLPEGIGEPLRSHSSITVTVEGEPGELVAISGLILEIGKSTGGGVLLSQE
ncbi:hypothetical protein ASAC_1029 [Acidilobus saccharovorans 345-15]|uniref:Uncharacterized protein n=2 Tax=Acidilobus TaxID=105850 RepID=D9Q296_ACIS3|nr:hypothetical protein ASAC_1029 [Acidilobus saccharovorans 345-15]